MATVLVTISRKSSPTWFLPPNLIRYNKTTNTPYGDNYRAIKLGNWQTLPLKEVDPFHLEKVYYRT